ncbi:MAG: hypothetical protein IJ916_02190 [Paludibacteraceae bacterium]|nr:hypothetical protein [Paludibacteraceae bacterium]
MSNGTRLEQNNNESNQHIGGNLYQKATKREMADLDRGDIRVFEKGVHDQPYGDSEDVQTTFEQTRAEQVETKRLFDIAKKNGLFIDRETIDKFGDKLCTKTGECEIFYNEKESLIYKVKDPFAKWVIKNLHAEDAIYEHIIHNLLFPNTRYKFIGIAEDDGNLRIVLSQPFISSTNAHPTDEEIICHLKALGLEPDGTYFYGNEYVTVTDTGTASDNVLKGDDGELYFIDPIIKLKKPAKEVIEFLINFTPKEKPLPWWKSLLKRLKR